MRLTLQLVIESDDRRPVTTDLLKLERSGLDPASLGLHLDEAKALLGRCQEAMASAQVRAFVDEAGICRDCGRALGRKGRHRLVYRTVFGKLPLESPRFYPCRQCRHEHSSTSPLASCLPERSSPELQYLQTKFAALMSYGLSVEVLSEVMPLADTLAPTSVRRCMQRTAERLEAAARRTDAALVTATMHRSIPPITARSPVKALGVDGGYVRRAGVTSRQEGWFEVMVGKSQREDGAGSCFAYVQALEDQPGQRMRRFLAHEGIAPEQPVVFLSDGGDTVRQPQFGARAHGEWVLDWFHIAMRFQQLTQLARALTPCEEYLTGGVRDLVAEIDRAKWYLWHGCPYRAIATLGWLTEDVTGYEPAERRGKFVAKVEETLNYLEKNREFVVNYAERHRHGEPIATRFVESAVNQVVSKRFVKKQQMAWSAARLKSNRVVQPVVSVIAVSPVGAAMVGSTTSMTRARSDTGPIMEPPSTKRLSWPGDGRARLRILDHG